MKAKPRKAASRPGAQRKIPPGSFPAAPPGFVRGADSSIAYGRYQGMIRDVSTERWDTRPRRRFARKAWIFAGAFSESHFVGFAIADAGYAGTAFIYAYDRQRREFAEEKVLLPFYFPRAFQPSLDSAWEIRKGNLLWQLFPEKTGWRAVFAGERIHLDLFVKNTGGIMSMIAPSWGRPFHFTAKLAGVPVEGTLSLDGRAPHQLIGNCGMIDFSKGYPPRHTTWNWTCLTGRAKGGQVFALNLVSDFNNGLENAIWIDGKLVPAAQALFVYSNPPDAGQWTISTIDDAVDITFHPEGKRTENIRAGFLTSAFTQVFGRFAGTIRVGGTHLFVTGSGVAEEHEALW